MTTLIKNQDVRTIAAGILATRATAALPQTATGNIFTVSGGRIMIVSLTGWVTTVMGATATTLSVGLTPTVGTSSATSLASATAVTSKEVGTHFSIGSTPGSALVVGSNAGAPVQSTGHAAWVINTGSITVTTSASDTGSVQWDLIYIPLDNGAQVSPA
ncbi:hypothetical protein ABH931_006148 [Streptacidiphilus sp. MAP12-33]|uniref:hypothetical protein n=1 Tax=Streptacidiphilus sp. MAP12-33 TaxID=3156266 RepID=UPI0035151DC1